MTKKGTRKVYSSGIQRKNTVQGEECQLCQMWLKFHHWISNLVNTSDLDERTFENDEVFGVSLR